MANTVVKMPPLGESVVEGTIGRWLKNQGDRVERDEPLVEIQTDKVNAEVASPVAGIVQQILLPEGTTVAVTTDLAIIGDEQVAPAIREDEQPAPTHAAAPPAPVEQPAPIHAPAASARVEQPAEDGAAAKRFYTPVVLRMAEEHAIDLETIQGTGAHGRVTRRDVERTIAEFPAANAGEPRPPNEPVTGPVPSAGVRPQPPVAPPAAPFVSSTPDVHTVGAANEERALSPMRRAIAEHMARARTTIPDAWSMVEIDVTSLVRHRSLHQADWQAREGYELTYLPFFIKAVVAGLRSVPELNATWAVDHITLHRQFNLGIAVSLDNGLVVPVLRDADSLSIAGIARALRSIVLKARTGKLSVDDLQGGTFTVNNPGSLGSILSQPIVPVGQAGIVTMEAIVKRTVVTADDAIAIRGIMNSALSFDHRVLDGDGALRFLREIKRQIETVEYQVY